MNCIKISVPMNIATSKLIQWKTAKMRGNKPFRGFCGFIFLVFGLFFYCGGCFGSPLFLYSGISEYTSLWLIFIRILPIRAEVCFAPGHHGLQNRNKALTEFGKRIFHFRRDFLVNLPMEETITFQFPELLCERGLRDSIKAAHQFPEPLDFVKGHIP